MDSIRFFPVSSLWLFVGIFWFIFTVTAVGCRKAESLDGIFFSSSDLLSICCPVAMLLVSLYVIIFIHFFLSFARFAIWSFQNQNISALFRRRNHTNFPCKIQLLFDRLSLLNFGFYFHFVYLYFRFVCRQCHFAQVKRDLLFCFSAKDKIHQKHSPFSQWYKMWTESTYFLHWSYHQSKYLQ